MIFSHIMHDWERSRVPFTIEETPLELGIDRIYLGNPMIFNETSWGSFVRAKTGLKSSITYIIVVRRLDYREVYLIGGSGCSPIFFVNGSPICTRACGRSRRWIALVIVVINKGAIKCFESRQRRCWIVEAVLALGWEQDLFGRRHTGGN